MSGLALHRPGGNATGTDRYDIGATLALLVHAGLIAALALGLHWRNDPPVVIGAELWAAVPQAAAPAAVPTPVPTPAPAPTPAPVPPRAAAPPPPAPRDAQIAVERARAEQRQAEEAEARRKVREADAQRKAAAEQAKAQKLADEKAREAKAAEDKRQQELKQAREQQADAQRIAKAREENLKRMMAQAASGGGETASGTAARDAGPSASLAGRIKARIKPNIKLLTEVDGNPIAEVEVRCAPDGTIIARRIVKPSGNTVWDETVLRAIDATRVLPRDTDGRIPATMTLVFPRQE